MLVPASASAAFGFEQVDVVFTEADGSPAARAGSHPFELVTAMRLNTVENAGVEAPEGDLRHLRVEYPPGLVFHADAVPRCATADFLDIEGEDNACPDGAAIGVASVTASSSGPIPTGSPDFRDTVPVHSLEVPEGAVGRIGFVAAGQPVVAEIGLEDAPPYKGVVRVTDLTQAALFYSARVSIWGNPADPAHDQDRGQCVFGDGICPVGIVVRPLLTLPRSCTGPIETTFTALSWGEPSQVFQAPSLSHDGAEPPQPLGLDSCGKLRFLPQIAAQPTTDLADTPSDLDFDLELFDEGLLNPSGVAQSETRHLLVTLPEGMIVNPTAAEGLDECTQAQFVQENLHSSGAGCPPGSQVGAVEVESPLLPGDVLGGQIFAGESGALYVIIKDPQLGILVKQTGEIEYDPFAEQLTVDFEDMPQLPVSHLGFQLTEDEGGLLLTPAECDEFTIETAMFPWSNPGSAFLATSSFETIAGRGGGPCPSGREPAAPPAPSAASPPITLPPATSIVPGPLKARRPCPRGRRAVRGKARCVRKRCRRQTAKVRTGRRCIRPKGRKRR